jgi:acyl-coenzyme A synthetase/AMP-(fatty) acid ligase
VDHEDVHHAVVVIVPKNTNDNDEIKQKLPGLIPSFFGNTKLVFVCELPRTSGGKIQRKKVMEMVKPEPVV